VKTLFRISLAAVAAATFVAAAPRPAHAIVGGVLDPNSSLANAGVASLSGGGGVFSAVLISEYFALTAAHLVAGSSPSAWTLNLNAGGDLTSQLAVDAIFVAPGYTGVSGTDGVSHNDLAVLRLAQPAPSGVPTYAIAGLQPADALTLVGYGTTGPLGGPFGNPSPIVKHSGTNVDDLNGLQGLAPFLSDVYAFDVDPGDATVAGGDSGSAAFVFVNGEQKLAGINTFRLSTAQSEFAGGGGMVLSAYQPWIEQVTVIPEPATWLTLLAGLAGLVVVARPRQAGPRSAAR
jgi:hypothetical protein